MGLETFFSETDINEIYNTTIIYSILKYQTLPGVWQEEFKDRYKNATQFFVDRNISPNILENSNLEKVKERLNEYEIIYDTNIALNRETIKRASSEIIRLVIYTIGKEQTEISKLSYLFDFITNYLNYSEDYNNYCLNVPPIDGFAFDFKNNIPVEPSINGIIVMAQGLCEDISNLFQFLGQLLNLQIKTITCNYKGTLHSLNVVTLSNGNTYLVDATRLIRKDKTKEECFMVSADELNKDSDYEFRENLPPTTTYKDIIPSYSNQIIDLINKIDEFKPPIEELNSSKKINLK